MTALQDYQRIEATALWRAAPDAQRREVIISIGDATLVITDTKDQALAHWSLAAVARANPGQLPAVYHPDGDLGETLEITEEEGEMITAIERLRTSIDRGRPRPGRLRLVMLATSFAAVAALGVFWLPEALVTHTVNVVPMVKREAIGEALLQHMQRFTGVACADPAATTALARLGDRLPDAQNRPARLIITRTLPRKTLQLPGRFLLVDHTLIEDYEEPDVVAGFIISEQQRSLRSDPLENLLRASGLVASFRLLTTGSLPDETLRTYAEKVLTAPQNPLPTDILLQAFKKAEVGSAPYAYALDITGEQTLPLIEADPFAGTASKPVLSDGDWVRLQGICGG